MRIVPAGAAIYSLCWDLRFYSTTAMISSQTVSTITISHWIQYFHPLPLEPRTQPHSLSIFLLNWAKFGLI